MKGQIEKRGEGVYRLRWYTGRVNGKRRYGSKTIRGTKKAAEKALRSGTAVAGCMMVVAISAACATTRGELDVAIPVPVDPSSDLVFQSPVVTDARQFEASPSDPSTPSLKKSSEIATEAVTSRAIARKRNSYGMAMGDIMLPEGRSVEQLAGEAIVRGFRESGLSVVEPDDSRFAEAIPVRARIDQFWAWMTPGFWAVALEFKTAMEIDTELAGFQGGKPVEGGIRLKTMVASGGKWRTTVVRGLENFSKNLAAALREAPALPKPPTPDLTSESGGGETQAIEACFQICKKLTERTDEECFDACSGRD